MNKITEEELKEINELRTKISKTVGESGQIVLQIKLLQEEIKTLESKISEETTTFQKLISEEQELVKRLSEKYGTGSINFETGEFTPEK